MNWKMQIKIIGHPKSYTITISAHGSACVLSLAKVIAYDLGCPTFFIYVFPVHIVKYTKMQIKKVGHPKSYTITISAHGSACVLSLAMSIAYDLGCPIIFICIFVYFTI